MQKHTASWVKALTTAMACYGIGAIYGTIAMGYGSILTNFMEDKFTNKNTKIIGKQTTNLMVGISSQIKISEKSLRKQMVNDGTPEVHGFDSMMG